MAEFVDVMEQRKRMCKLSKCKECPLYFHNNGESVQCDIIIFKCPTTAEKIIMDWAKEHPEPKPKTMQEVFLEKFPDSLLE